MLDTLIMIFAWGFGILAVFIAIAFLSGIGKPNYLATAPEAAESAVRKHLEELARKRLALIQVDGYGLERDTGWAKEWDYFFFNVLPKELSKEEFSVIAKLRFSHPKMLDERVLPIIIARANELRSELGFDQTMSPVEFEIWCMEQLNKHGWEAKTTKGSGDQGADVIAERNGIRVIFQCKHYSKPVGNKGVQEAIAARQFYKAQGCAVVAGNGFTKSAKELAASAGVHLLHPNEISIAAKRFEVE